MSLFQHSCVLLNLNGMPILEQLLIEECLLRCSTRNFCIINTQTMPAAVLGISRDPNKDLYLQALKDDLIPTIRRFSGGGTVYLDEDSLLVSWIINSSSMPLPWSHKIYAPIFPSSFAIREQDYTLGEKKIGGNAQYIQRNRWVHHTTFLWDMSIEKLSRYLPIPEKQPAYRARRSHQDFLTTIHPYFASKEDFVEKIKLSAEQIFQWEEWPLSNLPPLLQQPHRTSSVLIH